MSHEDIDTLKYVNQQGGERHVPIGYLSLIRILKEYHIHRHGRGDPIGGNWTSITPEMFDDYRIGPDYAAVVSETTHSDYTTPGATTTLLPVFKDDKLCDSWQRSTLAQAREQDVAEVMNSSYNPVTPEAQTLSNEKQNYVYADCEKKLLNDKEKFLVRLSESTMTTPESMPDSTPHSTPTPFPADTGFLGVDSAEDLSLDPDTTPSGRLTWPYPFQKVSNTYPVPMATLRGHFNTVSLLPPPNGPPVADLAIDGGATCAQIFVDTESSLVTDPTPWSLEKGSSEKREYWVGVTEHVDHAMTYTILTEDTRKIIYRSNIRSALDPKSRNLRFDSLVVTLWLMGSVFRRCRLLILLW
jgi:hypothetical protein